jgi:TctA family transporter
LVFLEDLRVAFDRVFRFAVFLRALLRFGLFAAFAVVRLVFLPAFLAAAVAVFFVRFARFGFAFVLPVPGDGLSETAAAFSNHVGSCGAKNISRRLVFWCPGVK